MKHSAWFVGPVVIATFVVSGGARADDAGTPSLAATDFALTLSRVDGAGTATVLTSDELATYFSLARCACPTSVVATLTLSDTAAATLGTHAVDAQVFVGNDCDIATATGCTSVGGTLTLSATKTSTTQTVTTAAIFGAASDASCTEASATSTRLWAIVRLDGARLATEPSLALTLGGAGPKAPTLVKTLTASEGLLVSWTASGDSTTLQGHQVLCAPGPTTASVARYDTCAASAPDGGAGPFAVLDPRLICSDLVDVGTNQVRVKGLENGRTYDIAVVAVGIDGTPSAPSASVQGTPGPTVGFEDLYKQSGGTAQAGCSVGGARSREASVTAFFALALALLVSRRHGRAMAALVVAGLACLGTRPARAEILDAAPALTSPAGGASVASPQSPHNWNLELRFGPYRPDVDGEFADRGSGARPYEQLFSSSRHLMMQLELDRQLVHRGGTWALGLGVGYTHATAAALTADLTTRSGDETGLRLIPLSAAIVYRADNLRERFGSPLVPYAKAGLDCTLWHATDTAEASVDGRTFGWHAAAGVTLDLSILDPEAARTMDRESGVNQTALFLEVARYSLDGFGSGQALHVGDTTWFAGLMLEL